MFRLIIATALALICTASPSAAAIVDWTFTGTVTVMDVRPDFGTGAGDFRSHFALGDPWRVDLSLNTETRNGCSDPRAGGAGGVYSFANFGSSTIGDDSFAILGGPLEMNTQDGNCGIGKIGAGVVFRFFRVSSTTVFDPQFPTPIEGALWWYGTPGYDIPTSAAGVTGGSLAMRIGLTNVGGIFTEATATVRAVPEPTTLLLFVAGAVALRRRRR
ncbi:hypothetical protein LuPra_03357 [Luteitalea pratensis]|uniref:Ice-binding protein C-terminal domain-containing protein n=1 Tax=Luteitalea pratensis TaxID=1855912 RepID=A0A143PQP6_LUTPR|nr:PEP-CTERM sorting domain-containing protein [Luteitalea pratensis]AMY10129.1 hypothetical protein LuPra_03357 [Luteitalea pratensis]